MLDRRATTAGEPEMVAGSLDPRVVDLASSDLEADAKFIRKACVECGFFYVSNHGIEGGLLEVVLAESKKFFELPLEEKMALQRNSRQQHPPGLHAALRREARRVIQIPRIPQ